MAAMVKMKKESAICLDEIRTETLDIDGYIAVDWIRGPLSWQNGSYHKDGGHVIPYQYGR